MIWSEVDLHQGKNMREEINEGKIVPSTLLIVIDLTDNSLFKRKLARCTG